MPFVNEEENEENSTLSQSSSIPLHDGNVDNSGYYDEPNSKRFKNGNDLADELKWEMFNLNPVLVAEEFLKHMKEAYPEYCAESTDSDGKEIVVANRLYKEFVLIVTNCEFVEDNIVELDDEYEGQPDELIEWEDDCDLTEDQDFNSVDLQEKIRILDVIEKHPNWTLKTIRKRGCRALKYNYYKDIWKQQVQDGGTRLDKLKEIDKCVYSKFIEARNCYLPIHDRDLKIWAVNRSQMFPTSVNFNFQSSTSWVTRFKKRHKITSRKVTKLVSRQEIVQETELNNRAVLYRQEMKLAMENYSLDRVINTDQTGVAYEIASNRTLSFEGEKVTLMFARSPKNKATHTYTVQITISADGKIVGPFFVCLQEQSGRLGPKVQENIFQASNVELTCSKSGKMTTSLVGYYLDQCIIPWARKHGLDFLFTFDNYTGQTDDTLYGSRFGQCDTPSCQVINVPPKCTSRCQPLDTTFNRQYKYLLRRVWDHVTLYKTDEGLEPMYSRNNTLKLQSLLHFQLSAPVFEPMIRYSWYSSGITDTKEQFQNVSEACFSFKKAIFVCCENENCTSKPFIQCSQCRKCICFHCWFDEYHVPGSGCVNLEDIS